MSGASGGRPVIVALHGVGGNKSFWSDCFTSLANLNPALVCLPLDLPGYGENQPCPSPLNFRVICTWLAQVLLEELQGREFVLVGQSYGGMIALDYASRFVEQFDGPKPKALVLMNTSPAFGKPDGAWQQEFINSRLAPLRAGKTMADVARSLVPLMLGSLAQASAAQQALAMMSAVPPSTYERAVSCLAGFDRRPSLPLLDMPVHCIAGSQDKTAPASVMQVMSTKFQRGSCEVIEGSNHLSALELPGTTAFLIDRFISGL